MACSLLHIGSCRISVINGMFHECRAFVGRSYVSGTPHATAEESGRLQRGHMSHGQNSLKGD